MLSGGMGAYVYDIYLLIMCFGRNMQATVCSFFYRETFVPTRVNVTIQDNCNGNIVFKYTVASWVNASCRTHLCSY